MDVFLGIDVGTTSIKAAAVDRDGRILSTAQVPCRMTTPGPGRFEIDAPVEWMGGFKKALDGLGDVFVGRAKALCVSSVCASFVPIDAGGRVLRNAILYGIDTRAAGIASRWNEETEPAVVFPIAGSGFTSHSVLPKIAWLREHEPEVYHQTAYFVESSNYLTSFLTGRHAWDRPTAAGGHMIDAARGEYPSDFLRKVGIDEGKLPSLRYPLEPLGRITETASAATGIPAGTTVLTGACDVNAEAFACGAFDPGSLLLVYGSTLSTLYTIGSFMRLPGFLLGPSILEGTYRLGGATSSGGRFLDWVKATLGIEDVPDPGPGPTDLLALPFLDGARIPYQDPSYRVLWYGMTSATSKNDYLLAAMESMGCELHEILRRFSAAGELPGYAHVTGGLASNARFLQVVADVSGCPLRRFKNVNAAFGDALMALSHAAGLDAVRAVLEARVRDSGNVEDVFPDPVLHARYEGKRILYRYFLDALERIREP